MTTRSKHRIRASAIALLALVLFAAPSAFAYTLRGSITDYSNYTRGNYFIYAVRLNLDSPVAGWTILPGPGTWEISGIPNGHYFVLAWRDVNGNFYPSRGEPLGYYGVPFPSRVTVSGRDVSGIQVVLDANNLGAELRGKVTYHGSRKGRIWVVPHTTPHLELTSVRGTPWTMNVPGDYTSYVLDHGTYYLTAFVDVNSNLLRDAGEPFGVRGPVNITVTPGITYSNLDIYIGDGATAVEPRTWSGVKSLYRD